MKPINIVITKNPSAKSKAPVLRLSQPSIISYLKLSGNSSSFC